LVVCTVVIGACSDQSEPGPSGPRVEAAGGRPSTNDCDFNGLNSLISQFFTSNTNKQAASAAVDLMVSAGAQNEGAIDPGFAVLGEISKAVHANATGSLTTGATLAAEVIKCMYAPSVVNRDSLQNLATNVFPISLSRSGQGAFEVRGPSDGYDVIQSYHSPTGTVLSAIAPPNTSTTWGQIIGNTGNHPVLIYGHPLTDDPTGYDWALIRPDATFNPYAIVALCSIEGAVTDMVNESSVGTLAFVDPDPATVGSMCDSKSSFEVSSGSAAIRMLGSLLRVGAHALAPAPLHATTMMFNPGLGGAAGGARSKFKVKDLTAGVTLTFASVPSTVKVNAPFSFTVTASDGSSGVNGVCIAITGVNNNGTPTEVVGPHNCEVSLPGVTSSTPTSVTQTVNGTAGIATFSGVSVTKTGALILQANGAVDGRGAIRVAQGVSKKLNVKP
jgi:hypothetical protein